jgi:SHOCT-like domain
MVSTEERMKVLKMLQEGKISAEEAANLLESLDLADPALKGEVLPKNLNGRWFRVRVTDKKNDKVKVNVRLPLSLVGVGLRMGKKYSPEMADLDIEEIFQAIQAGEMGQIVDVEDEEEGEHVQVFVE